MNKDAYLGPILEGMVFKRSRRGSGEPNNTIIEIKDRKVWFVRDGMPEQVWQPELEFRHYYHPVLEGETQ